jgi:hypothetical protein
MPGIDKVIDFEQQKEKCLGIIGGMRDDLLP